MSERVPFHLAFPIVDVASTRAFYVDVLGCTVGRESSRWIDFDFFGHQITGHLSDADESTGHNPVDGDQVPVRHFGAVLPWDTWRALADNLAQTNVPFFIAPRIRFAGEPGEQGTFFIKDPSDNALEFKSFKDPARMFAR